MDFEYHRVLFSGIKVGWSNYPTLDLSLIVGRLPPDLIDLSEFSERKEVINNALEAGPTIPFPNFAKLFKTWLKILTTLSEEQREGLFSAYIVELAQSPQKLITFNLDGILEIFLTLEENEKEILSITIKKIINSLDEEQKRKILLVIPDNAKHRLKF